MKNFTWSWDEPGEDVKDDEIDYPESLEEDIDALFDESDEEQCLDTAVEDQLTDVPWTDEEIAGMAELAKWTPIF